MLSLVRLFGKVAQLEVKTTGIRDMAMAETHTRDQKCDNHAAQLEKVDKTLTSLTGAQQKVAESVAFIRGKIEVALNGN